MDMYDNEHAHSGGSAEEYHKRQVSYIDNGANTINIGYDFSSLKKSSAPDEHQLEVGGMSPSQEVVKEAPKDGGFNFGSHEERMFLS